MPTLLLILKFLPQIINIIKKIKYMADDGFTEKEIKDALDKVELAFANDDDSIAESKLNDQWVSDVEEREVPPPLPSDKTTKSES